MRASKRAQATGTNTTPTQRTRSRKASPPVGLQNFDDLPDSAHVRVGAVAALYGCSVNTVWRRSKEGTIPKPRRMGGNVTAWNVGKLRKALGLVEENGHA